MTPDPGQAGGDPGGVAGPVALAAGPASSVWRHSRARAVPLRSRGARGVVPHSDLMAKTARPLAAHRTTPRRRRRARKNTRAHTRSHTPALIFYAKCTCILRCRCELSLNSTLFSTETTHVTCIFAHTENTHTFPHTHTHADTHTHTDGPFGEASVFQFAAFVAWHPRVFCVHCDVTLRNFWGCGLRSCGDSVAFPRGAFCGAG